ncbi:MAG: GNAT family N-acetyltransferase [Planctomycetota bacterium]
MSEQAASPPVRPPRDESELRALAAILQTSFRIPDDRLDAFVDAIGQEHFRQVTAGGEPAGGLALVHMGQFFGGRSVRTAGVVAVGIAPHLRQTGAGSILMRSMLRELHERGEPLSTLYPATLSFYRRFGYEQAGGRYRVKLPLGGIEPRDLELPVRPITSDDETAVESLYRRRAERTSGNLDRGPYIWRRVRRSALGPVHGFLCGHGHAPEGYLYYTTVDGDQMAHDHDLVLTDVVALTPAAARTVLAHLAGHRSMAANARLASWPGDPMLGMLREAAYSITWHIHWMLRLVCVPEALEARGYPKAVRGEVHLRIADDLLPGNTGCFVLSLEDGRGQVRRGGDGRLNITVHGLASLYGGLRTPQDLLATGQLHTAADDLDLLAAAFAGPTPWMPDVF